MSTFEKIFEIFYGVTAIIWSAFLIANVVADVTEDGKFDWKHVISIVIIINLALFMLIKCGW